MADSFHMLARIAHLQAAQAAEDLEKVAADTEASDKDATDTGTGDPPPEPAPKPAHFLDFGAGATAATAQAAEATARYNQAEQLASSIEKKDADTKQAIIDKIGREAPPQPEPDAPDLDFGAGAVLDAEPEHAIAEPTAIPAPLEPVEPAPAGPVPVPYPNTLGTETVPETAQVEPVRTPEFEAPEFEPVATHDVATGINDDVDDALSDVEDNQSTDQFDIDG